MAKIGMMTLFHISLNYLRLAGQVSSKIRTDLWFWLSVQERGLFPGKVAAQNSFDDPVIGTCCGAHPDTDIYLPLGRNIQVGHQEDLLLLIMQRIKRAQAAVVCVVFDTAAYLPVEVVTELHRGRKAHPLFGIGTVPGTFERWVHGPIPAAHVLVDNGSDLPGPGIARIDRSLIANLCRHTYTDRPMPRIRHSHSRPDVVTYPLHPMPILPAGKHVETHFRPAGQALRDLQRLV